jgi:hypothetical protein
MTNEFPKHMKVHLPRYVLAGHLLTRVQLVDSSVDIASKRSDSVRVLACEPFTNFSYEKVCIYDSVLRSATQDSDGEVLGFESLVALLLEFVHCIVERESFRDILNHHLPDIFYVSLSYVQLTRDQVFTCDE